MPAGSTYTPIATTTLGSATNTVTFNSFSGYTDLVLVMANIVTATVSQTPFIRFNGDTGTNYSGTILGGNGTSPQNGRRTNYSGGVPIGGTFVGSSTTEPYQTIVSIMNYANTTTYKTVLARYGRAGAETEMDVGLWRNTSAITSFEIRNDGAGNFNTGSTFTLYGIASA